MYYFIFGICGIISIFILSTVHDILKDNKKIESNEDLHVNYAGSSGKLTNKVSINYDEIQPFRDLPFKDDYYMAFFVSCEYGLKANNNDFYGSIILKMIFNKNIELIKINDVYSLKLIKEPEDGFDKDLYNKLRHASGNNILEDQEFINYLANNYGAYTSFFDQIIISKFYEIKDNEKYVTKKLLKKKYGKKIYEYLATYELDEKAIQLAGLKKFLSEFTLINEKDVPDVKMWNDYLIYAQLFGLASEVSNKLIELYGVDNFSNSISFVNNYISKNIDAAEKLSEKLSENNILITKIKEEYNENNSTLSNSVDFSTSSTRARDYSSGGGGFSSGGGGGGSFGGGGGGGGFR